VLLPQDLFDGGAQSLAVWIIKEIWQDNPDIWNSNKKYALAFSYDPVTYKNLGLTKAKTTNFG
jgi:hypothetical protein